MTVFWLLSPLVPWNTARYVRATGRATGTPDGFLEQSGRDDVNGVPLAEGVTFTLPTTFQHIWTFAAVSDIDGCPLSDEDLDQETIAFAAITFFVIVILR